MLVINLDRSPERLARIGADLEALGLPWQRLPAADGRQFDLHDPRWLDAAAFRRRHGKHPMPGELGCYLSHVWAMQALRDSNHPWALVLEDDAHLTAALPEVLHALASEAAHWDLVKLSGVHRGSPLALRPLAGAHRLCVTLSAYTGSSAYVVQRTAAEVYARGLLPMKVPYDHEFDRGWHWGLQVRAVFPAPCLHDQGNDSTIEKPRGHQKLRGLARWPAYGWRLGNGLARLGHGLWAALWRR